MINVPPQYVNVPSWLLYEVELSAAVRQTGMLIYGLGWQHQYEYTDRVTITELCKLCGLSRSRLYGHLQRLVVKGVLRYTSTAGAFVFDLRPARAAQGVSPKNRTGRALSVVVDDNHPCITASDDQQQQVFSDIGGECEGGVGESQKWDGDAGERLAVLDGMGVLEPTRSGLARLAWATVEYLERWAEWLAVQDDVGVGVVVTQVRAGMDAPALSRDQRARLDLKARAAEVGWR